MFPKHWKKFMKCMSVLYIIYIYPGYPIRCNKDICIHTIRVQETSVSRKKTCL